MRHRIGQRYALVKQDVMLAQATRTLYGIQNPDQVLEQSLSCQHNVVGSSSGLEPVEPYWAEHWQSAFAMDRDWDYLYSKHVRCRLDKQSSMRWLELGCGGGVLSLALACRNIPIVATDYARDALLLTRLNAAANKKRLITRLLDWTHPNGSIKFDVIVAADIAYDRRVFQSLNDCLATMLDEHGVCIIGEPSRSMGDEFIDYLLSRRWHVVIEDSKEPFEGSTRKVRYLVVRKIV